MLKRPQPEHGVDIPEPADSLLRQLWLLKGSRPLDQFVAEFNSWGEQERNNSTMRTQDQGRRFTAERILSYLLGKSKPTKWDRSIIAGRIRWLRYARSCRAKALKADYRTKPRDPTPIGMREDKTLIYKDATPVVVRDRIGRPIRKRNPTAH